MAQPAVTTASSPALRTGQSYGPISAKSWFSITPGEDGKIIYFEVPKDGEQASQAPAKAEPTQAVAAAAG